jgi:outer membrane protein
MLIRFLPVLMLSVAMLAQGKIGVINIQQAILSTRDGQKAAADLQTKFDPKRKDLQAKQEKLQQLNNQLKGMSPATSEAARASLQRELETSQKSFQRDQEDAQAEFEQEQGRLLNEIGARMMQVLEKYSRDNGYVLVLDVSTQQSPVLYMSNTIEVTNDVVLLYDKNAPSSIGAPATPMASPAKAPAAPAASPAKKPVTPAKP